MMTHTLLIGTTLIALAGTASAQPTSPPPAAASSIALVEVVEGEGTPAERRARFEMVLPSEGGSEVRTITGTTEFKVRLHRSVRARAGVDTVELDLTRSERRGKDLQSSSASMTWTLQKGQRTVVARIAPPGAPRLDVAVTVN